MADGVRRVPVAYSRAEAAEAPGRLAFEVDATFGKSVVIVFFSDRPLFPELRRGPSRCKLSPRRSPAC